MSALSTATSGMKYLVLKGTIDGLYSVYSLIKFEGVTTLANTLPPYFNSTFQDQ